VGDFDRALVFARRASDTFRQQGRVALLAQTLVLETFSGLYLGRWDVTHVASGEAARFGIETEQPVWTACAQLGQANLAALQGDRAEAETLAATVEQVAVATGNRALLNGIQLVRGLAALGVEAPEQAWAAFGRMMDPADVAYQMPQSVWALDQFADAAAQVDRRKQGRSVLGRIEALAAGATAPGVLRSIALARVMLADEDEVEARFDVARALAGAASPWYRSRLDLAYGSWLRRGRRIAEARDALRSAQVVFDALGAAGWTARAERELRAAGQRPQHGDREGWARLSAQELQIAQLAAQGLSNREIGERLYLSHRTIGSNLYRIFPKLGIRARAQLHEALGSETATG
jgi:DNA-binding CsgD family transcriptional regulator